MLQRERVRSYHGARKRKIRKMTATRAKIKVVKARMVVRKAEIAATAEREVMTEAEVIVMTVVVIAAVKRRNR